MEGNRVPDSQPKKAEIRAFLDHWWEPVTRKGEPRREQELQLTRRNMVLRAFTVWAPGLHQAPFRSKWKGCRGADTEPWLKIINPPNSQALWTRGDSYCLPSSTPWPQTLRQKRNPVTLNCRRKRQLSHSLSSLLSSHPTHPSMTLCPMWWCMGNVETKLQVRSQWIWNRIVEMISSPACAQLKRGKVPHRDLVIMFKKKKKCFQNT